ncbi:GNAT family N-acetyltransferase [Streptomyces sp. NPDC048428]|uniref:GNAT family N-acetyltransferase n=1 Tax=Streptomyces sp. NPDC048428 TaxID=3154503 RepID=UPI00341F4FB6
MAGTERTAKRGREWRIAEAETEQEIRRCWPVFRELRHNIPDEELYVDRWRQQRAEGYRISFLEREHEVLGIAGYRLVNSMAWGRIIYLDDLGVLEEKRGEGLGAALLEHVKKVAEGLDCEAVHLDTGYHRKRAHRTYLRNGFELESHHLKWEVSGT